MILAPALGLLLLSAHLATVTSLHTASLSLLHQPDNTSFQSIDIPKPLESLPIQQLYQPQPPAKIPVTYGERSELD